MKATILLMIFLLFFSLSFSALIWQIDMRGEPTTQPLQINEKFIIGSSDGNVYAFDMMTGKQLWKAQVGRSIDLAEYGSKIIVLTKDGVVIALDNTGKSVWTIDLKNINKTINATYFYGLNKNSKNVFVVSDKCVYKVGENNAVVFYVADELYGKPYVDENVVLLTAGKKIIKLDANGKVLWSKELNVKRWESDFTLTKNFIYFGALDNNLYQISNFDGSKSWTYPTSGWIRSTPLVRGGAVYFGSNDGYFYKVNENGELEWKTEIGTAVATPPISGTVGEKEVVFASGTNGKLYAFSVDDGAVLWTSSSSGGILTKPIFYKDRVAVASIDHFIYIYSMKKGCSIESPRDGEKVGYKEVTISGKSFSTTGQHKVFIKINDQNWIETQLKENNRWVYYLDPQQELQEGINIINCKVEDVLGTEEGAYATITFIRDSTIPLDDFIVSIPDAPVENAPFDLYVNSKSDGTPVERFEIIINNQKYNGDKKITLTLAAGSYEAKIQKMGYNDKKVTINVQSKGINPLYIGGGLILLLALIWFGYTKLVKK
ncbi:MAG: PQQ-binding-like beta-propeller repeat protein [Candidatus Bilamarchaeaceae archaeon]